MSTGCIFCCELVEDRLPIEADISSSNILCGAVWTPFIHLSSNLLQTRYEVSEKLAAMQSAILLAGAIILYPIVCATHYPPPSTDNTQVGHITDRLTPSSPKTTFHLLHLASTLTLLGFTHLSLSPSFTGSPWLGMILYALGNGSATLLLVILIPRILPPRLVPLGLGLHKSMEMASSTLVQTLSGVWLDHGQKGGFRAGEVLLRVFWVANALQLLTAIILWRLERSRRKALMYEALPLDEVGIEGGRAEVESEGMTPDSAVAKSRSERKRGKVIFGLCVGFVCMSWIVFGIVAWEDLK
jgi:hypothetical protein